MMIHKCAMCDSVTNLMELDDGRYICETCAMIENKMGIEDKVGD